MGPKTTTDILKDALIKAELYDKLMEQYDGDIQKQITVDGKAFIVSPQGQKLIQKKIVEGIESYLRDFDLWDFDDTRDLLNEAIVDLLKKQFKIKTKKGK